MNQFDLREKIVHDLENFACSVIGVFTNEEDRDETPHHFAYSIGLSKKFEKPEILVVGLPPNLGHQLINNAVEVMKKQPGGTLVPGQRYKDVIGNDLDVIFIECYEEVKDKYTIQAGEFYGHQNYSVLQMVWPDKHNKFQQIDADVSPQMDELQPIEGIFI